MGSTICKTRIETEFDLADRDVIILGGGLAGIAAAVRFLKHGVRPTLVERRPYLGGRAFSFSDRSSGEEIDNGQHVILGACDQFLDLIDELGTSDLIDLEPTLNVPVSNAGRISNLRASRIFGNVAALMRYNQLSLAERFAVARVMAGLKIFTPKPHETKHAKSISFAEWLSARGQSDAAIARFWSLFILPVFNCKISEVAAHDAIEFTRAYLIGAAANAAIGYPNRGLSTLIGNPAEQLMRTRGAEVLTNVRIETLTVQPDDRFEIGLSTGETLRSKTVITCLAPTALSEILPANDHRFAKTKETLDEIEYSPIVAVHLWYERPVMNELVTAFVDLGLQWVFNDTALRRNSTDDSQHIVVSLSGADEWATMTKSEVLSEIQRCMKVAFPKVGESRLIKSSIAKTLEATIKVKPNTHEQRLDSQTSVPGLYLAGDWTDTGLPATMEGAVRSGNVAAELAFANIDQPAK